MDDAVVEEAAQPAVPPVVPPADAATVEHEVIIKVVFVFHISMFYFALVLAFGRLLFCFCFFGCFFCTLLLAHFSLVFLVDVS